MESRFYERISDISMTYLIHHIFLPPKLPLQDDFSARSEAEMLKLVLDALHQFKTRVDSQYHSILDKAILAVTNMVAVQRDTIDEVNLCHLLQALRTQEQFIPLHIRAQNAGVIISKSQNSIQVESFELSPLNEAVMTTKGRLRRTFPGPVGIVSLDDFAESNFREMIAHTLAKMSHQSAIGMTPKVKKSYQMHDEDRDTTDPCLVTELFMSMMCAAGNAADVPRLHKNTRQEVLWLDARSPWRRSPSWLFIRVSLHIILSRSSTTQGHECFKSFMIFLLSSILKKATHMSVDSELLYAMTAKVSRRLLKMNSYPSGLGLVYGEQIVRDAEERMQMVWHNVRKTSSTSLDIMSLGSLDFASDTRSPLPQLENFVKYVRELANEPAANSFQPKEFLLKFNRLELPTGLGNISKEYKMYNLAAFETWVEDCLASWLESHKTEVMTCQRLGHLIRDYHNVASSEYERNPEALSLMFLTITELWIACDESATGLCPLLKEYDPGVSQELFRSLLLPRKDQMERLQKIELYLEGRKCRSKYQRKHIFDCFGSKEVFAVRYFEKSTSHQTLLKEIERRGERNRQAKKEEFRRKKSEHESYMRQYNQLECKYDKVYDSYSGLYDEVHNGSCQKCKFQRLASSLEIQVDEWPLPSDPLEAQAVAFELHVPLSFGHWRDITLTFLVDILGNKYQQNHGPRAEYPLHRYLSSDSIPCSTAQRVVLLSEDKPHLATHRQKKKISMTTEADICLKNGLHYRYFDNQVRNFASPIDATDHMAQLCTHQMAPGSSVLQKFIYRPVKLPEGPSSNTVISSLHECPDHICLGEYKALGSIPLGVWLQWYNVSLQIYAQEVDFRKMETSLVVLQTIHQAGPPGHNAYRQGHQVANDDEFALTLLRSLRKTFEAFEKNWDCAQALSIFISLTTRLISLTKSRFVACCLLEFLSHMRKVASDWANTVKAQARSESSNDRQTEFETKVVELAMICVESFNVEDIFLEEILNGPDAACILLQAKIMVQERDTILKRVKPLNPFLCLLHQRYRRLSYRAYPILSKITVQDHSGALDTAVKNSWSAYNSSKCWRTLNEQSENWLVNQTKAEAGGNALMVHFDLLTGELLVDGCPIARLPAAYTEHSTYHTLFGASIIEVMPSQLRGMRFSATTCRSGYTIHFNMIETQKSASKDLLVQAEKDGITYIHIPARTFKDVLPRAFVRDYLHWFNAVNEQVEFRPISDPWLSSSKNWVLSRQTHDFNWVMEKNGSELIWLNSFSAKTVSAIFDSLQSASQIHVILQEAHSLVEINLPQLQLDFYIISGQSSVYSKQFRGLVVDEDQTIETLVGLSNKLVLKHKEQDDRTIIIPEHAVSYHKDGEHIIVRIEKDSAIKVHSYLEDKLLGRLVDNGSLQSKLFLCYLHALTSSVLVDPLIGRTGTEQALSILRSAAVRSFEFLTQENVQMLNSIALLSPQRHYYPANEQVMQSILWSSKLGSFAQHGAFFLHVEEIFRQSEESRMYYPDSLDQLPELSHVDKTLLYRDLIRTAQFRAPGFGAEDCQLNYDQDYSSRDRGQSSLRSQTAFQVAKLLYRDRSSLISLSPSRLRDVLLCFLKGNVDVQGQKCSLKLRELSYDSEYLSSSQAYLTNNFAVLHRVLSRQREKLSKPQLMAWFSTMAFGTSLNIDIIQTIAAFYLVAELQNVFAPSAKSFRLSEGIKLDSAILRAAIKSSFHPLQNCQEAQLQPLHSETAAAFRARQRRTFEQNQQQAFQHFFNAVKSEWPCTTPTVANKEGWSKIQSYIDVNKALEAVKPRLQSWYNNHFFDTYLAQIVKIVRSCDIEPISTPCFAFAQYQKKIKARRRFISQEDLFRNPAPEISPIRNESLSSQILTKAKTDSVTLRLPLLLDQLRTVAQSDYERSYLSELRQSSKDLAKYTHHTSVPILVPDLEKILLDNLRQCKKRVTECFTAISTAIKSNGDDVALSSALKRSTLLPRIGPLYLLSQLSRIKRDKLREEWKQCLVNYGLSLTEFQRAQRLVLCRSNRAAFVRELENIGHTNWSPSECLDSLLLEIENNILIRENQEQVATAMRGTSLIDNSVMQLNMGEGKSSVIVPKEAAALADGSRLVRVIVAKPQSRQMLEMLVSKLGGLLNRRVYHLPFSRALRLDTTDVDKISKMCQDCKDNGGILLILPEHILSFYLMGLECKSSGKEKLGQLVLRTQDFFDNHSRDLVDESDENFSVKFELIYSMGTPGPIELSPDRWRCMQEILNLVKRFSPAVLEELPLSMEIIAKTGSFPRTRVLKHGAHLSLSTRIAKHICETGIVGFPIARQPDTFRSAVLRYISEPKLTDDEIKAVESVFDRNILSGLSRDIVFLLRGILAGGILSFALGQKRWRVNYGLDSQRRPPTRLAVPYRAKDSPSLRSEFSHPDVVILLTQLSYYYGGLQDEDLFLSFGHLLKADQAAIEYQEWVQDAPTLPPNFHQLVSINLKDRMQCVSQIFPCLRFAKRAIDYFLNHMVFPKEMREFPHKLSASGWDIGKVKAHLTTGFSGTNDSKKTLPLSVEQLNLPQQSHTNALVLEYLLQPENSVMPISSTISNSQSDAEFLLTAVTNMENAPKVVLDVGAQILQLSNVEVAKTWLALAHDTTRAEAAVYFDDYDELSVIDRQGKIEPLRTSTYAKQLDLCLVFLDESHTRGTDLKLPSNYRAAVTLGPNLTKDRLVQACMRMRMLGQGQSVVFCVTDEICEKIMSLAALRTKDDITILNILKWSISETWAEVRRSMPLWAAQGERFERQNTIWTDSGIGKKEELSGHQAYKFLEDESRSLEDRYRPQIGIETSDFASASENYNIEVIRERCRDLSNDDLDADRLQEEQERELAPETEQEKHFERPAAAEPAIHQLHDDISRFVESGILVPSSSAYEPAFKSLRGTSAAKYLDLSQFPGDLLVSADFSRTIKVNTTSHVSDAYQRPVQWILTSMSKERAGGYVVERMLIISPHEANLLFPRLKPKGLTTLHIYAPRPNMGIQPIDNLNYLTRPSRPDGFRIPEALALQLNLFAGQLYFSTYQEYINVCNHLGLAWDTCEEGSEVAPDGFILRHGTNSDLPKSSFSKSPVNFLKVLMTKIRRNCEAIDKTHMGKMLAGIVLHPMDIENDNEC